MTDRQKDSLFYGPLFSLPLIVVFFSSVAQEIGLVVMASVGSVIAIALLLLIRCFDRYSHIYLAAAVAAAVFILSIAITHWPLRATFAMARAKLDDIANRGCGAGGFDGHENAGVFTISSADRDDIGACRLSTSRKYAQLEFVRLSGSTRIEDLKTVSHLKLDDDWYLVEVPKPSYDNVLR